MASIQPISTTRVTSSMTRDIVTAQIQADQLDLFTLQNQLSTGFRIFLPSDDASAAQRAIELQRTLERKDQSLTNLQGARDALSSAEAVLADLSNSLNLLASDALGAVDSFSSDEERQQLIDQIDAMVNQIVQIGNSTLTGSYFFGGSETASEPYTGSNLYVEYTGDESATQTYIDIGYLFNSSIPGDEVFGGLSDEVFGVADLDPQPTPDTRLSQINGGNGVSPNGAIEITFEPADPSESAATATINLSQAETLGDVARLIESNGPEGADLTVTVSGDGFLVEAESGTIAIAEVADGNTAAELGILHAGTFASSIAGEELDPALDVTTPLSDLNGTKARGLLEFSGDNNDLALVATANGVDYNNLAVEIVDGAVAGSESASYDDLTNTLTITVADGESTAEQVAAAINSADPAVPVAAETDYRDALSSSQQGAGPVSVGTHTGVTAGGSGDSIDLASGLRITNGSDEYVIDTSSAETVEDLLNLLNSEEYGLSAAINDAGDGLDVRSRRSGADFTIGENGGSTATDLGVRSYTEDSLLADFNLGIGVIVETDNEIDAAAQNEFTITLRDGGVSTTYEIDLTEGLTVQDVIDQIAADTGGAVTAELAATGNGLTLTRVDAIDAAATATGSTTLNADTGTGDFEIVADSAGAAGNRSYTVEFVDSGAGGLATTVLDGTITVDLGGATPDTDAIAASIDAELPDHTVSSTFTPADTVAALVGTDFDLEATGGFDADEMTISGGAAERLGFFTRDEGSVTSTNATATSTDQNPDEVDSIFTTLLRMRDALEAGDQQAFESELNELDEDIDRVTYARGSIGVSIRTLDSTEARIIDETVQLQESLSLEIDADLVQVISDYTAKQVSLEASMQVSASLMQLSILNYL